MSFLRMLKTSTRRKESTIAAGRKPGGTIPNSSVLLGTGNGTSRPAPTVEDHSRMKDMEPIRDPEFLVRALAAFDLCETAEQIMQQNLRRWHPQASEEEIRRRFRAWLEKRPYAA